MAILLYNNEDVLEIISKAGAAVIPLTLITSLVFDPVWIQLFKGNFYRVGATPAGTCVDTGNLLLIMLIPVAYQVIINRKMKEYLWAVLLGLAQILLSGSKSSVLPIVLVFAIMLLGSAKDKKTLRRSLLVLLILAVVGGIAIMTVPLLYTVIGERIVEMFTGLGSTEFDLGTSTGQRMAVVAAVKEHFWEKPIFGHGFYAFKEMPYSAIEEFRQGTEISYRHIQIHMNFCELLFSYGLFGFLIRYFRIHNVLLVPSVLMHQVIFHKEQNG